MTETLRPCPFSHKHTPSETLEACGPSALSVLQDDESERWAVHCILCGTRGPMMLTKKRAVAAWNSRAEPTPEALEAWAEWADVNMKNEPKYLGPVQLLASGYLLREIARRMRAAREDV